MFKKKIDLKELISENYLADMADGDVYQIIQKGQDVKVLMTQEHYFQLMARLEKSEGATKTTKYNPDQLMSNFEELIISERDFEKMTKEIENPSLPNDRMKKAFKNSPK